MLEKSHLPSAVTDVDPDTILDRDEFEIRLMAEECGRWLKSFGEYRASLVTPPARAVWTALVQREFDDVARLHDRLQDEIEMRAGGTAVRVRGSETS